MGFVESGDRTKLVESSSVDGHQVEDNIVDEIDDDDDQEITQEIEIPRTNGDNKICHLCGGQTVGLFSEFFGARYCPKCKR